MTTLQQIALTCPVCVAQFAAQAVLTTNSFGGKRTDFHERAAGAQPLPYLVHVCPRCGYAGTEPDFGGETDVSPLLKAHIWDELAPKLAEGRALTGSEKYEFAAKVAAWQGAPARRVADLELRAAWCCVDEGDIEAERYFRRLAAHAFDAALATYDGVPREERAVITYLVGELWRRVGDVKLAKEWFDRVEHEIVDAQAQQWVLDAARQQASPMAREWFA